MMKWVMICVVMFMVSCTPQGKEGEWLKIDSGRYEIKVTDSMYTSSYDEHILVVRYRIKNTGKESVDTVWDNKLIIDKKGRQYDPLKGGVTRGLQPLTSSYLGVIFILPSGVDIRNIWFSHSNGEGLTYKIKLHPIEVKD